MIARIPADALHLHRAHARGALLAESLPERAADSRGVVMAKHTQEPWAAECCGVSSAGPDAVDVYEIVTKHRRIAENLSEHDARRIVACINALAGVHTETLDIINGLSDNDTRISALIGALMAVRDGHGEG